MSKKQKIISIIAASLAGVSAASITSVVIVYDKVFPRCERPDYAVYAGQYCIERIPELTRTEIWIPSEENRLKAYYYEAKSPKGLVVFGHGIKAGADEYLPIFKALNDSGYSVLAHNVTGTYESEGDSTVGMCQSLVDMDNVIGFVQSTAPYNKLPLFTMGHSWGGYAAASVLALKNNIKATALIAPVCDGSSMMMDKASEYAGDLIQPTVPVLNLYQKLLFKDYVKYDAIDGINTAQIPVLIAQGRQDKVITFDKLSIVARQDEIVNQNVRYYIRDGLQGGHDSIWHSERSEVYRQQVENELKALEKTKGGKLTYEEKVQFYKTVDHALFSEVNSELMTEIIAMFDSTLK